MEYTEQDYALAAETCDRFAVTLQGVEKAAGILRAIGSLNGQVKALKKQVDDLAKERDAAQADFEQTKIAATAVAEASQAHVDEQKALADEWLGNAKAQAEKILKDASDAAALDLANAKAEQEEKLSDLLKKISLAQTSLKDLEAKTAKANENAAAVEARGKAAQEKLDQVLAAAKAIGA